MEVIDITGPELKRVANRYIPAIFPGVPKDFSFIVEPDKANAANLVLTVRADNEHYVIRTKDDTSGGGGSGGCNAMAANAGVFGLLAMIFALRKKR